MKANSNRKNSSAIPVTKLRRVIKLDASQFAIYKTGKIDIVDPTGEAIDVIGNETKLLNENELREKVVNNLRLLEELFLGNTHGVQLSEHAIAGLSEALSQAQKIIGNYSHN